MQYLEWLINIELHPKNCVQFLGCSSSKLVGCFLLEKHGRLSRV